MYENIRVNMTDVFALERPHFLRPGGQTTFAYSEDSKKKVRKLEIATYYDCPGLVLHRQDVAYV